MRLAWCLLGLVLAAQGCKRRQEQPAAVPAPAQEPKTAAPAVGQRDPFARPLPEEEDPGLRLVRARALLRAGKPAEARAQVEQALRLDLPGGLAALAGRDLQPLRDSAEGPALRAAVERLRPLYAAGIEGGLVLVARSRPARTPLFRGPVARLAPQQEAYHYDPASARYRRLSETGGQVLAALRAPDGRTLSLVLVSKLGQEGVPPMDSRMRVHGGGLLVDAAAAAVDLRTLAQAGPFPLPNPTGDRRSLLSEVRLGFSADGQPLFQTVLGEAGAATYILDTARTGLVRTEAEPAGAVVLAAAQRVVRDARNGAGTVAVSESGTGLLVRGSDVVVATREIAPESLVLSPQGGRLVYAGRLDACAALRDRRVRNELYLYDIAARSGRRLDSALGHFAALWLSEDLLAYDRGLGAAGAVQLLDLRTDRRTLLRGAQGAGLFGLPVLLCQEPVEESPDLPALPPPPVLGEPEPEEEREAEQAGPRP
jgi:hypothetical protein